MPLLPFTPAVESRELTEDIRALFDELAASLTHDQRAYTGECQPTLDVFETDAALAIVVDLSGVPADAMRVLLRNDVIVVAGEKAPAAVGPHQNFHLVEREFGRFARAVRVTGAFDVATATATLRHGELTITLPKRADRRGAAHRIAVTTDRPA